MKKITTIILLLTLTYSIAQKPNKFHLERATMFTNYISENIELSEDDSHIKVTLEDNGVGFSELKNNIKDILNPYFTTKKNGTGLGLSIVNKIINDHNGKIDFIPIKNGAKINITFLK